MIRAHALATLLLSTITTSAWAEPHVWQNGAGFTVRATGLDLGTTDGRAGLLRRVDVAAAQTCRFARPRVARDRCAEAVRADALATAPASLREPVRVALRERAAVRFAGR